jgi:hypothetical protein
MAERLLFVGPWWWSLSTLPDSGPNAAAGIGLSLGRRFEVSVFNWPTMKRGPSAEPTWQAVVELLRQAITPGTHVVDAGPAASLSLLAVSDDRAQAASLVTGGMIVPPATLRALGMTSQAVGSSVFFGLSNSTHQLARLNLQGADEEVMRSVSDSFDEAINWPYLSLFQQSLQTLNLVEEDPRPSLPVLYLDPPLQAVGYAEMAEVMLRFAPQARVELLEVYPISMQDERAGLEFVEHVTSFIQEVAEDR